MTKDPETSDAEIEHVRRLLERLELGLDPDAVDTVELPQGDGRSTPLKLAPDLAAPVRQDMVSTHGAVQAARPLGRHALLLGALIAAVVGVGVLLLQGGVPDSSDADRVGGRAATEPAQPKAKTEQAPASRAAPAGAEARSIAARQQSVEQVATEAPGVVEPQPPAPGIEQRLIAEEHVRGLENPPTPPADQGGKQESKEVLLTRASAEFRAGRVGTARTILLEALKDSAEDADVLWALARTYNPSVVSGIAGADTAPDVTEAERLLRRWHEVSVAQGLISPDVSVDQILRSMQSDPTR